MIFAQDWPPNLCSLQFADECNFLVDFETPEPYLSLDTVAVSDNIWQVGTPSKVLLNNTFSGNHAIVTDSLNPYPINNHSYFDLYIGGFNICGYPSSIFVEMYHQFDTDTLQDGGYITVSFDKGETWKNIIGDFSNELESGLGPPWESKNIYSTEDVLYNGEYGFSGRSEGLVHTAFAWYVLGVGNSRSSIADTAILRFNFISDSLQNNREGWLIDHIKIYSCEIESNVQDLQYDSGLFILHPNPAQTIANVKMNKIYSQIEIQISDILGNTVSKSELKQTAEFPINISDLDTGLYFVRLIADHQKTATSKLIVR
ncbi:MAG: T9SS type A sorting domain-containing protein [Sphingobacteriales bacterium]|nr:MAG: T9SS type A sorting domain-containing protein [Sphingobacteriales bacterium]